mmetsp:Transcript_89031/g.235493  ORF Transcript_89031/g.235493 Transcript_89031/m.235493 type:complete len:201 (-) Transcript_89031:151-753(-)
MKQPLATIAADTQETGVAGMWVTAGAAMTTTGPRRHVAMDFITESAYFRSREISSPTIDWRPTVSHVLLENPATRELEYACGSVTKRIIAVNSVQNAYRRMFCTFMSRPLFRFNAYSFATLPTALQSVIATTHMKRQEKVPETNVEKSLLNTSPMKTTIMPTRRVFPSGTLKTHRHTHAVQMITVSRKIPKSPMLFCCMA